MSTPGHQDRPTGRIVITIAAVSALVWASTGAFCATIPVHPGAEEETAEADLPRFVDDRVWLPYVAAAYLRATDDHAALEVALPFIAGAEVAPGHEDAHYTPTPTENTATLYEHCARALDVSYADGSLPLTLRDWMPFFGLARNWRTCRRPLSESGTALAVTIFQPEPTSDAFNTSIGSASRSWIPP